MAKKAEAAKLNIRPLGDRVVVQAAEEDEVTFAGGKLVLPETAKVFTSLLALGSHAVAVPVVVSIAAILLRVWPPMVVKLPPA